MAACGIQPIWRPQGAVYPPTRYPARHIGNLRFSCKRLLRHRCSLSAPVPSSPRSSTITTSGNGAHEQAPSGDQTDASSSTSTSQRSNSASESATDPNEAQHADIWCLGSPSATASLQRIRDELYQLSGRNTTAHMNKILRRDPQALASRSSSLRALVATLIDLRENPPANSNVNTPTPLHVSPWSKAPLERSLFQGEVRRVHRDLLKSQQELLNLSTARAAHATAAPPPTLPSEASKDVPKWVQALTSALFLNEIVRAVKWLRRSFTPRIILPDFSLWSLRTVQRFADELPHDAELQVRTVTCVWLHPTDIKYSLLCCNTHCAGRNCINTYCTGVLICCIGNKCSQRTVL